MLLPSALGFSPFLPVSVCGTGTVQTIEAFPGSFSARFATFISLPVTSSDYERRLFLPLSYLASTGLSSPGSCFASASPQFCYTVVQESQPVVHRLRLSTSP